MSAILKNGVAEGLASDSHDTNYIYTIYYQIGNIMKYKSKKVQIEILVITSNYVVCHAFLWPLEIFLNRNAFFVKNVRTL